jgi:nucleosome binding factor SPN SPT16 subunit
MPWLLMWHVLKTWLLGYEFPSTLILFQKDKLTILCSASKGALSYNRCLLPEPLRVYFYSKDSYADQGWQ